MNTPKYKIGQEVYGASLHKDSDNAIFVHKISRITISEKEGILYTMYIHEYKYEEDQCNLHTYTEEDLYATVDEAKKSGQKRIY